MRHVPTLMRRELAAYFLSPIAYLILLAFQVIAWVNFYQLVEVLKLPQVAFSGLQNPMNTYIAESSTFWIAMMVAVPALTMRLLAEERRAGTIESLLTTPVTEAEVVVGKWLAGVVMYLVLLLPFVIYLPILRHYGKFPFDTGPLISLGIGLTTAGMMFVAIGLFFSALTRNQVVAAVGTFVTLFGLLIVALLGYREAANRQSLGLASTLLFVAVLPQVQEFGRGLLDLRFVALHLSIAAFLLYLTVKVLQSRQGA